MRVLLQNHLENAHESLKANKGKTALTIIGTAIGIAGISLILTLAGGIEQLLGSQRLVADQSVAIIRSGVKPSSSILVDTDQATRSNTLTADDASKISEINGVTSAPIASFRSDIKSSDTTISAANSVVVGSTASIQQVAGLQLNFGQFIGESIGVVIGNQLSVNLFGAEDSIGSVLYIRGEPMTVVGVLKPTKNPINYLGVDFDNSLIIPLQTAAELSSGVAQIQQIAISTSSPDQLKQAIEQSRAILAKNHKGDHDWHILSGSQLTESSSQTVNGIALAISIIAGVSLLVGGIGIMNIMLVNVAERQREIGIRKAVGATRQAIINQFLIESAIIGLIGGVAGYAIGIIAALAISDSLPFTPLISWQTTLIAISTSVAIGVLFGAYPAIHAARKNPIELLRL